MSSEIPNATSFRLCGATSNVTRETVTRTERLCPRSSQQSAPKGMTSGTESRVCGARFFFGVSFRVHVPICAGNVLMKSFITFNVPLQPIGTVLVSLLIGATSIIVETLFCLDAYCLDRYEVTPQHLIADIETSCNLSYRDRFFSLTSASRTRNDLSELLSVAIFERAEYFSCFQDLACFIPARRHE